MDEGHRILDARSHLVALMAGQLIEAHGLRDIEATLAAHAPALLAVVKKRVNMVTMAWIRTRGLPWPLVR
jgi:hypothetical protein